MTRTILLILLILLFTSFFTPLVASGQAAFMVAVGDSLTAGDGDNGSGGGYPARLLDLLDEAYPGSSMTNLAISGDTSNDLVNKQLTAAVTALNGAAAGTRKIGLVWIGSNDLFGLYASTTCQEYYPGDMALCESTEMGYSFENLDTILSALSGTGAEIFIALLDDQSRRPVINDGTLRSETFPDFTVDEIPRMSTQVGVYNTEVASLAGSYGATTVDFLIPPFLRTGRP
jgi:lysophospholipase L1-like esterase